MNDMNNNIQSNSISLSFVKLICSLSLFLSESFEIIFHYYFLSCEFFNKKFKYNYLERKRNSLSLSLN